MMVVSSPKLSGFVLLVIPLIVLPLVLSGRGVGRRSRAAQDRLAEAMAFATESLGAMRTVQVFGAEALSTQRFDRAVEQSYDAAARAAACARHSDRRRHLSRLRQRRGGVVARRA